MTKAAEKDKSEYVKKDYKKKFKELNLFQAEDAHQKSKYEKLNKLFTKSKTSNEDNVNLGDSSGINYSYISECNNSSPIIGLKKSQSHMIPILLTMAKSAAFPLAARTTIESTVADRPLL